ncbi:hypothetical protein [Psychroflexus tropicus]|uniref:hypothetical protein n=1 Tax=Psychroflexus tropicus TaxID=197345 RepID=UPI000475F6AE|nr:hypothetical protein [Psychroflexus tropicus]
MNLNKSIVILFIMFCYCNTSAQTDLEMNTISLIPSLSMTSDPFSVTSVGKDFNLPEINIFADKFSRRPEVDMVAAANRKAYRAQQQKEQNFSFIERQGAIFSSFKPKFDNSSNSIYAPSYHQQPIYSDLNRIKNSAYEDLGDKYNRLSPFFQLSPYRRNSGSGFYFSGN